MEKKNTFLSYKVVDSNKRYLIFFPGNVFLDVICSPFAPHLWSLQCHVVQALEQGTRSKFWVFSFLLGPRAKSKNPNRKK